MKLSRVVLALLLIASTVPVLGTQSASAATPSMREVAIRTAEAAANRSSVRANIPLDIPSATPAAPATPAPNAIPVEATPASAPAPTPITAPAAAPTPTAAAQIAAPAPTAAPVTTAAPATTGAPAPASTPPAAPAPVARTLVEAAPSPAPAPAPEASTDGSVGDRVAAIARQQVGKAYRSGATGPSAFDCSGLVFYVFNQAGVSLPRLTDAGYYGRSNHITSGQLQPGDIVWSSGHIGIYVGDGMMVHASASRGGVKLAPYTAVPPKGFGRLA